MNHPEKPPVRHLVVYLENHAVKNLLNPGEWIYPGQPGPAQAGPDGSTHGS